MYRHHRRIKPVALARSCWTFERGDGFIVADAIHTGHLIRPEVATLLLPDEAERLREEDSFTDRWAQLVPNHVIVHLSRFEVDMNRPRDKAVYQRSEDAWGIELYTRRPPAALVRRSLAEYDAFYTFLQVYLDDIIRTHGGFLLLDFHSYNHKRDGTIAPEIENPEVNLGTGKMNRDRWSHVVDTFIDSMRTSREDGVETDVRENVRFFGGYLAEWVHDNYPKNGCALAIEFKKTFVDELTGTPDLEAIERIAQQIRTILPALREAFLKAL